MSDNDNARLLFGIGGVKAYHIQNGEEHSLTATGPQTLSMLMVPTFSEHAPPTSVGHTKISDQDYYLHLNLPPELDLPLPATTQIYHQPPSSYLIPRGDMSPDEGAFTRIEFPRIGHGPGTVTQEDVDTFETILAQCTAFHERAIPHQPGRPIPPYSPADYSKGGKYHDEKSHGQVVLIDEENGSVVGELAEGANVVEDPSLQHGSKNPVEIQVSADGKRVDVRPISEDYLALSRLPQYEKSSIVQNAAAASRLIVTGSSYLGNMMSTSADNFTQKTKPAQKPLEFKPATHDRVRKINNLTVNAAGMSSKAIDQVSRYAQNMGATVSRKKEKQPKLDKAGNAVPAQPSKPGLLNKSLIAFTTIADGLAQSGKTILTQSGAAASTVVGHRYGEQAGSIATDLAGGVRNVGLVYIDVTGVSRRAVIKSVAKGMVVGKMKDGKHVVVGEGDGGQVSEHDLKAAEAAQAGQQYQQQDQYHGYQQGAANNTLPSSTQETGTTGSHGISGPPPPAYDHGYYGPSKTGLPSQEKGQYRY